MTDVAMFIIRFLAAAILIEGVCSIVTNRFFGFYNTWGRGYTKRSKNCYTRITGVLMMLLGMLILISEFAFTMLEAHPTAIMKWDLICAAVFVLIAVIFRKIILENSTAAI